MNKKNEAAACEACEQMFEENIDRIVGEVENCTSREYEKNKREEVDAAFGGKEERHGDRNGSCSCKESGRQDKK